MTAEMSTAHLLMADRGFATCQFVFPVFFSGDQMATLGGGQVVLEMQRPIRDSYFTEPDCIAHTAQPGRIKIGVISAVRRRYFGGEKLFPEKEKKHTYLSDRSDGE